MCSSGSTSASSPASTIGAGDFDGLIRHAREETRSRPTGRRRSPRAAASSRRARRCRALHARAGEVRPRVRRRPGRHRQDLPRRRLCGVTAWSAALVERIILSRPAVEAGERLGFLPGDMREKVDPYLRPLYDALYDVLPPEKVERDLETGRHRDRAARFHARAHAGQRLRHPRRGAEHHQHADEDVPHPARRELEDGRHRRPEPDRPAVRHAGPASRRRSRCSTACPGSRRSASPRRTWCAATSSRASSKPTIGPGVPRRPGISQTVKPRDHASDRASAERSAAEGERTRPRTPSRSRSQHRRGARGRRLAALDALIELVSTRAADAVAAELDFVRQRSLHRALRTRRSRSSTRRYRGKPTPTNVLSFSAPASDRADDPLPRRHRACGRDGAREAEELGHPVRRIICSTLSCTDSCTFWATIINYRTDAEAMEGLRSAFSRLGIADPYAGGELASLDDHLGHEQRTTQSDPPRLQPARLRRAGPSTQSLLTALLGRFGLRSPSLREMLEAGLKERARGRRRILDRRARDAAPAVAVRRLACRRHHGAARRHHRAGGERPACRAFASCSARRAFRASPCSARRSTIRAA